MPWPYDDGPQHAYITETVLTGPEAAFHKDGTSCAIAVIGSPLRCYGGGGGGRKGGGFYSISILHARVMRYWFYAFPGLIVASWAYAPPFDWIVDTRNMLISQSINMPINQLVNQFIN